MWTVHTIKRAFQTLRPPSSLERPLMTYLDELAHHLEDAGFEPSSNLEEAAAALNDRLNEDSAPPAALPIRRGGTSVGLLLSEALRVLEGEEQRELHRALCGAVAELDADLRHVLWVTPRAMENARDRLGRVVAPQLHAIVA